jgi:hypothetical protein
MVGSGQNTSVWLREKESWALKILAHGQIE